MGPEPKRGWSARTLMLENGLLVSTHSKLSQKPSDVVRDFVSEKILMSLLSYLQEMNPYLGLVSETPAG